MYTVTFYSFKGGVGRSMAMMNVASELVSRGRKVLVVDFDLEAPGLETFNLQGQDEATTGNAKGIVDFVSEYLDSNTAPAINDFVYKSSQDSSQDGELWLMPAGIQGQSYPERLNSISWRNLYEKRDGYLLFEDLKAQWEKHLNPDYVLIDSRTGHTDVGGICTRQLPDAVVFLFFPSEQNLAGLTPVVDKIRKSNEAIDKNTVLHFVTSNVPDLDDEQNIRGGMLDRFQKDLGYAELASTIHHYPSLALLNQDIFTRDRPKSRLAGEYRQLVRAIQKANPEDREGALEFIEDTIDVHSRRRFQSQRAATGQRETKLEKILSNHSGDVDILKALVVLREREGRLEEMDMLLTRSLKVAPDDSWLLIRKAISADRLDHGEDAAAFARKAAELQGLDASDLDRVIRVMINNDREALSNIESWPSISTAEYIDVSYLNQTLTYYRELLPQAERLIRLVDGRSDNLSIKLDLVLVLVGQAKFEEAIALCRDMVGLDLSTKFNLAMAVWGAKKIVPESLFQEVIDLDPNLDYSNSPNYLQCISLANWVVGNDQKARDFLQQAIRKILSAPNRSFSYWSYLNCEPSRFSDDLLSQERFFDGAGAGPALFEW